MISPNTRISSTGAYAQLKIRLGETSIAQAIGDQLSGIAQDVVDFSETVPGNIEETMASNVEAGKEVGSSDKEPKKPKALPDINDLLNKTMKIDGIDTDIPVRNSLMSQTLNT